MIIRILKVTFIASLFINLFLNPSFGAETVGTSGADFLELGIGSRAQGLGGAFTAEINDIHAIYYNPAGLGTLQYPVLSIEHQELVLDSRFENISFSHPLWDGNIGISNSIFWVPSFDKIDIDGNVVGDVVFFNGAFTLGYGYDLGFIYVGANMKYIYQRIDTLFLHSFAMDFGILKGFRIFTPFDAPLKNFHVGISMLNIGTQAGASKLPRMFRIGLSYQLTNWLGINVDLVENMLEFSDLYDFVYGFDESFRVYTGFELTYLELLSFRFGYRFNEAGTYTFGLGFNYVIGQVTFTIDAAYADAGEFGSIYSFNVSFKLIPKVVTIEDRMDAEGHYRKAIRHYISGDLNSAIEEFRITRDLNPYHKHIDKRIEDLEELRDLKKKNLEIERDEDYQNIN